MNKKSLLVLPFLLVACGDVVSIPDPEPLLGVIGQTADASPPVEVTKDASVPDTAPVVTPDAPAQEPDAETDSGQAEAAVQDASPDAQDAAQDVTVDVAPPVVRYAVSFPLGTSSRLENGIPVGLPGSTAATFEGWFYVRSLTEYGSFFSVGGVSCSVAGSASYGADQGKITCLARRWDSTNLPAYTNAPVPVGRWFHLSFVVAPGIARVFVDGQPSGATTPDFASFGFEASHRLRVGGTGRDANESIDGMVDEFRVSLTADHAAAFVPPTHLPSGQVCTDLDQGSGNVADGFSFQGGAEWVLSTR